MIAAPFLHEVIVNEKKNEDKALALLSARIIADYHSDCLPNFLYRVHISNGYEHVSLDGL